MTGTGLQSACPQCGAPLHFGGARSLVSVCQHCRSAVARADVDVALIGRVPDLVATDTRLALGASGKLMQRWFTVLGRVQLDQGAGVWDEWYLTWQDGTYGWLAEARGRVIVTRLFERPVELPPPRTLHAGENAVVVGLGEISVEEVGEAVVVSAQGELPFRPQFGARQRFVDASMSGGRFVTIDYGTGGDEVQLFVGQELSYAEAGMAKLQRQRDGSETAGEALVCPRCGAPMSLKSAQAHAIVCDSCRGLCHVSDGKLALLSVLGQRKPLVLPLGASGELFGERFEVIGCVKRTCRVEDMSLFEWDEYLLHGPNGYRWLAESNGHFTLLEPIPAARVRTLDDEVTIDGREYRHFQSSNGVRYVDIRGEFYWHLRATDEAVLTDYVAPPYMACREETEGEVNWTCGQYLPAEDVWRAFGQPGKPPAALGLGPSQPNPYAERSVRLRSAAAAAAAVMFLCAAIIAFMLPRRTVLALDVPISVAQAVTISDPFEIAGGTHAAEIRVSSPTTLENAWIGLDIALINDATGEADEIGLEIWRWVGVSNGERWSEGSFRASDTIGSVAPGRYVLRVESFPESRGTLPMSVHVQIKHGVFLWFPLFAAVALLALLPLVFGWLSASFERRRWLDSDHPSTGIFD